MKHPLKSLLSVVLLISLILWSPPSYGADTVDQAAQKMVRGTANTKQPSAPPVSVFSHSLLSHDNKVMLSGWNGTLKVPASTSGTTTVAVEAKRALTSAATIALVPTQYDKTFSLVPAHTATINLTKTNCVTGRDYYLVLTTSGTTSYTLTFGTNFKSTGTLATGTTTAKVFVIHFVYDGTNLNEVSRTTAM